MFMRCIPIAEDVLNTFQQFIALAILFLFLSVGTKILVLPLHGALNRGQFPNFD